MATRCPVARISRILACVTIAAAQPAPRPPRLGGRRRIQASTVGAAAAKWAAPRAPGPRGAVAEFNRLSGDLQTMTGELRAREQQASDDYKQVRIRLEQYAQQKLPAEAIIAAPCDASDITP